jgi:hypothetical protein
MSKRKSLPKNDQDKLLNRKNLSISLVVGMLVILTFIIELPQKIKATIDVFKTTNTPALTASPTLVVTDTPKLLTPLRIDTSKLGMGLCSGPVVLAPSYIDLVGDPVSALEIIRERQSAKTLSLDAMNLTLIDMTITSTAPTEYIRLSNKVFVEIIDYQPLSYQDALSEGCGGGAEFRDYSFRIDNSSNEFEAENTSVDYYTLQPGELEVFSVSIRATVSGVYKLRLGIEYMYQGKTGLMWALETFHVYTPERFRLWQPAFDPPQFQVVMNGVFKDGEYISASGQP